ncbi:uncharacterized protein LOC124641680 isoform X2 [Helicoverpa zea]|uniref:uncharacterized protein LOC124641680 isoform X2 n=1 Tax=Helicoverpa zea TaxID=7113 RepID=UPI001F590A27|nr:uncharacterized protein LOC124641680 isoform X2 [Helicoverpa zea]
MNEQSAFIINEESHEKIVKEDEEEKRKELARKKTNARQRAYYQRQKDLKKNAGLIKKTVPKSNAERQRKFRQKFRQHNAEKSYMDIVSVSSRMPARSTLRRQARKIIFNVANYMQKEKDEGVHNVAQVQRRTAEATGVSIRTVSNILREAKKGDPNSDFRTPGKNRNKPSPITGIDDFDKGVIKRCIYTFHVKEKAMPSISRLLTKLQTEINFKGSASSLSRIIKELGFKKRKTENNKMVFVERTDIRLKRIEYLKQIKKYRDEGKKIVYTAETSVCLSHPKGVEKSDDVDKSLKGQKIVAIHAGSEDGFVANGLLMFVKAGTKSDKDNMNFTKYETWLRTQLIPNLPPNSVVVIDNAPYHNKLRDPAPASYSRKEDMEAWLTEKGIPYEDNMLKPELYQLICQNKSASKEFMIDHILAEHNHVVLRSPPHHPDLSPIEMAWAAVKGYVTSRNVNFDADQAMQFIEEKVSSMGQEVWMTMCNQVKEIEGEYLASDHVVDNMTESLIIDTDDSSESEYESEDDDEVISDYNEMEDPLGLSEVKVSVSKDIHSTSKVIQPPVFQINNIKKEKVDIPPACSSRLRMLLAPATCTVYNPKETSNLSRSAEGTTSDNVYDELLEVKQEFDVEIPSLSRSAEGTASENVYDELLEVKQEFDVETSSLSRSAEGTASENVYDELLEVKQEFNMDIKEEPCFEVPITNNFTAEAWPRYSIHTHEVQNDPLADHADSVPSSSVPVVPSSHPVSQPEDGQPPTKRLKKEITTLNMLDPCAHIPSTSSTPMETEDALPSTSAIPTTAEKNALRNREYRKRVAATRTPEQAAAFARKAAERQRKAYHLRRAANLALASGTVATTKIVQTSAQRKRASRQRQAERVRSAAQPSTPSNQAAVTWSTKWSSSIHRFKSTFLDNDFGHTCSVCDRLWFRNDLKAITAAQMQIISDWCVKENRQVHAQEFTLVCANCKRSLNTGKLPSLAKMNGFTYPEVPPGLPPLDPISERLISPRLPFMQIRRLRHDFSYGIIGQVINVPVDVQEMVKCLPRQLDEDEVINVNIKRNLAHKTNYISGYTSKRTIKEWLDVLQKSSLYRLYDIKVDLSKLQLTVSSEEILPDEPGPRIEAISAEYTPESEILAARQHTLLWNEEDCLDIAPGHWATALNIIYDRHAEELSFPAIYFGEPRRFNMGVTVTPYMMATSEIRRSDRRGATPQKILYVAMKILRLRMVDGIYSTFRKVPVTENVTRRMLEDPEFLKEFVIQNLAFMKSVPNSVQYWTSRKRDLFAMLRQLGKPTIFLTLSANEVRWLTLLNLLLKLSKKYPGKVAEDLNTSERCSLVSDDPVTCCIYFHKLVGTLMNMLKAKSNYNPFGQYFVKDYFLRIEFQHRGSPHAHILLWLNNDPLETVSENMPNTIELVEKLSSVAKEDVPNDTIYSNQIHKHTFTCTKRGETTCRFGIPYWPMLTTRVLVPMPKTDGRRVAFQKKGKELRTSLSDRTYASMDDFLRDHSLTFDTYLDVVRSTLRRPTLLFKRNFDQLMTNTFNPYLAGEINSNIDIQFVLDDYSCAQYVVEYVNKSARGMGNLNRELVKMMQEHPDRDYTGQLKALSIKLLNAVEMSAQEAAWYLLRQPMSETSRQVVYIPSVWPSERQRCRKRRVQMNREGIDADSTDVWTKNVIQRYEERPPSLEPVYLAEFASWYFKRQDFIDNEDDVDVHEYENLEPETEEETTSRQYRRRQMGRIIRYRHYEVDDIVNYQREMVLLYLPFRNELSEIVDCNKFLQLYNDNKDVIMERRQIYEKNLNIDSVLQELEAMMILQNSNSTEPAETEARRVSVEQSSEGAENNDDVNQIVPREGFSVVKNVAM